MSVFDPRKPAKLKETAITVADVSKRFRLFRERPTNLKERVTHLRSSAYDDFWALKNVTINVPKGSAYGLIGHNGSGKSTLLRLMAGIHRPTSGHIEARGRVSALLELGAGFHPELSGRENIYLNGSILGLTRREINAKVDEIIEFAGLGQFIDSPVKVYSSGMYVRLGFSIAVHVNPDILIIDEVIAVGDEEFQRRCFDHLYRLRKAEVTIVLVTHSLGLVQTICDRAAWLDHGELKAEGAAAEVVRNYLDEVNVQEVERLEHDASADATVRSRMAMSERNPIVIDGIEFLDGEGVPTVVGTTGAPLTVRLHYVADREVLAPLFSFAVENQNLVHMATPGMRPSLARRDIAAGAGYVDCMIERLALAPGEYTFSVAIHDAHGMVRFDVRERYGLLKVQGGEDPIVAGAIDLFGEWMDPVAEGGDGAG